jgi:glutamate racemase
LTELKNQFHGVNVKLMKSGSYQTGIQQLKEARRLGMQTMIGCMVETSLGISSALCLTSLTDFIDLDGHLIVSNEPFHLIDERGGMLQLKQ